MKSHKLNPFSSRGRFLLSAVLLALAGGLPISESKAAMIMQLELNEGSGTVAANSANASAPGTLVGAGSGWTTEVPSNFVPDAAYYNNGTNGAYVSLPATSVGALGDFTITGWMNVYSAVGTSGAYDRILAKNYFSTSNFELAFRDTGGGMGIGLDISIAGTTAMSSIISNPIDFSVGWLFIATTRDSTTGRINIYLGTPGAIGLTLIGTGLEVAGTIPQNSALLTLGNVMSNTGRNGEVSYSDFRMYDTALSAVDLEAIRLEQVPEPGSLSLVFVAGAAAVSALLYRRKRKNKAA